MWTLWATFTGELAALGGATIWAIASLIYARLGQQVSPLALNFAKGAIAIALIGLTLVLRQEFVPDATLGAIMGLLLSGAIGVGLGDTAFFASLNCVGARRGLLLESLAPPIAALIALVFLQEQLAPTAWWGIVLTVLGVAWVVVERTPDTPGFVMRPRQGILLGILAAWAQAMGAVLSRAALTDSMISPLWSGLLRIIGGILVLLVWVTLQGKPAAVVSVWRSRRLLWIITGTSFLGTYLGIWLQQIALKFTETGIAQALNSTTPLFVIPIAVLMGDRVSFRAILGAIVALSGIWLLFVS